MSKRQLIYQNSVKDEIFQLQNCEEATCQQLTGITDLIAYINLKMTSFSSKFR